MDTRLIEIVIYQVQRYRSNGKQHAQRKPKYTRKDLRAKYHSVQPKRKGGGENYPITLISVEGHFWTSSTEILYRRRRPHQERRDKNEDETAGKILSPGIYQQDDYA